MLKSRAAAFVLVVFAFHICIASEGLPIAVLFNGRDVRMHNLFSLTDSCIYQGPLTVSLFPLIVNTLYSKDQNSQVH